MSETLGQKQRRFTLSVSKLIAYIYESGYEATMGDAFRDPRAFGPLGKVIAYGNAFSCHKARLAIDLNLFKGGAYLSDTESYRQIGEWWEAQADDHCWGGRFKDGNHFSITHEGIK